MFEAFALQINHAGPTHRDGGVLDLVAARDDVPVCVVNVDHSLLHWPAVSDQPITPTVTVNTRSWRRLHMDLFHSRLAASTSCQPSSWSSEADQAASLYDDVISRILDDILPTRLIARRPRPSEPWFDADCRAAKRLTHRLQWWSFLAASRGAATVSGCCLGVCRC